VEGKEREPQEKVEEIDGSDLMTRTADLSAREATMEVEHKHVREMRVTPCVTVSLVTFIKVFIKNQIH
jgi:hypothetical protein